MCLNGPVTDFDLVIPIYHHLCVYLRKQNKKMDLVHFQIMP